MTTPAANTPNGIIIDAMMDAGLLQDGDEPNGEQYAKYMRRLNDLINLLMTQGIKLFLWVDQTVTLVAGTATYTLKPGGSVSMTKPLRVISAYYADSNQLARPLNSLSWDEYTRLSNKTQQGPLNSYFANKLATEIDVTFWLVPDATAATGAAHLILQTQATNPITLNETMAFPQEWRMTLRWGLADDICTGQPESVIKRCQQKAQMYKTMLEDWDVEDADTSFAPDTQQSVSRFR